MHALPTVLLTALLSTAVMLSVPLGPAYGREEGADARLEDLAGQWVGAGWARRTPNHPQERVRCRIENRYDAAERALSVDGLCAVAGRQLPMVGFLRPTETPGALEGRWENAVGPGAQDVEGRIDGPAILVDLEVSAVGSGDDVSQTLDWRETEDGGLMLRSVLLEEPDVVMSEILFEARP